MASNRGLRPLSGIPAVVALALCLSPPLRAADAQPHQAPYVSEGHEWDIVVEQRRTLIRMEAWDELEALAEQYKRSRSRFRSGLWKLAAFYDELWPDRTETHQPRDWSGLLAALEAWRAARPRSTTALTALASAYVGYAWESRGGGYADSVESAGWRLFAERLRKAREFLEAAERLDSRDPHTYALLLEVARGEGWDQARRQRTLEKALALAPGYQAIYTEEAFDLLPRWHGDPGDVERFAERAVGCCKDEGEGIYARIVWSLSSSYKDNDIFEQHHFSWPRVRRGFEILRRMYPDSRRVRDGYCRVACLAGDRETAKKLFDEIGDDWTENVWHREADYLRWRRWARAPR